ncbi:MAG: hypothetical protein KAH84_01535 [Thiomargarita sp.]|nr:hypothetical protein [Thiomargarita sp.]
MQYRRAWIVGGTYFFTVNLAERLKTLLVDYVDTLRNSFRKVKSRHPFEIDAIVIFPENDSDYATRWMLIKQGFSRNLPKNERRNIITDVSGKLNLLGCWSVRIDRNFRIVFCYLRKMSLLS